MVKVLVCGGGGGAHVLAGLASSHNEIEETRVLTLFEDEAERWTHAIKSNDFVLNIYGPEKDPVKYLKSKPKLVTKDASIAVPGVDVIVITVPAFAHAGYLEAIKPHVQAGVVIVGLPGQAGFEFAVPGILGDIAKMCTIVSFETLPWVARVSKFGQSADVLAIKDKLAGGIQVGNVIPEIAKDPTSLLQRVIGEYPKLTIKGHIIAMTLMAVNGYIHPPIMYGRWHDWDGKPVENSPLFYQGLRPADTDLMSDISYEMVKIAREIEKKRPAVDMSSVEHLHEYYLRVYPKDMVQDNSTLFSCMTTFKGYEGLTHPCIKGEDGMFRPNFESRYLTEDVPYGMLVMKGIASIAGVDTPNMDKVLNWCQEKMGKDYISEGRLNGKDIYESRVPQAYGITSLDEMLGLN